MIDLFYIHNHHDYRIFRELVVTYGNRLEKIGTILVEDSTTYHQAKAMVKSMVRKYFASTFQILNEKEEELSNIEGLSPEEKEKKTANLLVERDSLENLVENFVLADANGKPVTGLGTKVSPHYLALFILNSKFIVNIIR